MTTWFLKAERAKISINSKESKEFTKGADSTELKTSLLKTNSTNL